MVFGFGGFDFGKALQKQVDQYRRTPLSQQQRLEGKLQKAIAAYAQKYLQVVINPGTANPGQLKNAAEILVEAAAAVKYPVPAYTAFADMVARSRKVPVIPGLAGLVDRLLEVPTNQAEEQAALLNWRISTGSMRPERHLKYLADRARLTGESADWKDYSWGLGQFLKKGTLKLDDELTIKVLKDLLDNKVKLGDRVAQVQLMWIESLLAQRQLREAESGLLDMAALSSPLPETFIEVTALMIEKRPEANWKLHEMVLRPALASLIEGKLGWPALHEMLQRSRRQAPALLGFLIDTEAFLREPRMQVFVLEHIIELNKAEREGFLGRWREALDKAGLQLPHGAQLLLAKASEKGMLPEQPEQAQLRPISALPTSLSAAPDRAAVREMLAAHLAGEELPVARVDDLLNELEITLAGGFTAEETRFWLCEQLLAAGQVEAAVERLRGLNLADAQMANRLRALLAGITLDPPPPGLTVLQVKVFLAQGDYQSAYARLGELSLDHPERGELLRILDEWINAQLETTPQVRMVLAQVQRDSLGDPQAGFEVATTAALLAPDDAALQETYGTWLEHLPPDVIHAQRSQQACYLCTHEGHGELVPVALNEIEALTAASGDDPPVEAIGWLDELRPLLDAVPAEQAAPLRLQWTKLYLLVVVKGGRQEQLPAALQVATAQIEPEAAEQLVAELGDQIPSTVRLVFQYEALLRQGDWQRALDLADQVEGLTVSEALPVRLLCDKLPQEAWLPAGERLARILAEQGDDAGQLDFVKHFQEHCAVEGGNGERSRLQGLLDSVLSDLCSRAYEPAVRYRLELGLAQGDPVQAAQALLALARQGDSAALDELMKVKDELLAAEGQTELKQELALELARALAGRDPDEALRLLVQVGVQTSQPDWALGQIEALGLQVQTAAGQQAVAELALGQRDFARVQTALDALIGQGEHAAAQRLAEAWLAVQPDADYPRLALLRTLVLGEPPDYDAALVQLFRLAQFHQHREPGIAEVLQPVAPELEQALAQADEDQDAEHLRLTLAALIGDHGRSAALVSQILNRDPEATDKLLALFDRLAMQDADLPAPMVIACGRTLFKAGRVAEALDRLAGLREAVGDYPEYISLLEEIKDTTEHPGACMQLGEAYLRVHLWQRSAEEYALALDHDPTLAEPVLTQLRHHAALDPNPMKFALHVLALRAVARSRRQADWGWALSALAWLRLRGSTEELYELAQGLWQNSSQVELSEAERLELLMHLFKLAGRLSKAEAALDYLSQAWALSPVPGPELLQALRELDRSQLPDDPQLQLALRSFELQAAVLERDTPRVIAVAREVAKLGGEGRALALRTLAEYQEQAANPSEVLVARLKLLDMASDEGRQTFVNELLAAAEADLPVDQVHSLIHTVLELSQEMGDSPLLGRLLLLLLIHLGDQARSWQLALAFYEEQNELAGVAHETLERIASDEFALSPRIVLAELKLLSSEPERALELLNTLTPEDAAQIEGTAVNVAEALLAKPSAPAARRWLIDFYRNTGRLDLAADHLVWAHNTNDPQPAEWLHSERSGDLLYRSGLLHELQGNADLAQTAYDKALSAGFQNNFIAVATRTRLSTLLEQAGETDRALTLAREAAAILPGHPPAQELVARLEHLIRHKEIQSLQGRSDSTERTLAVARLYRASNELAEAINELQSGISRGQDQPEIFVDLAECFLDTEDYNIARRAFGEVLKRLASESGNAELKLRALYGLASAEERLGDIGEAVRCLEQILVVRQNYRDSRERLKQLYGKQQAKPAAPAAPGQDKILGEILSLLGMPEGEEGKK